MPSDTSPEQVTTTVKGAAQMLEQMLGLPMTHWAVYKLLDANQIESRYKGRRRLVVIESLHAYVDNLPAERPEAEAS